MRTKNLSNYYSLRLIWPICSLFESSESHCNYIKGEWLFFCDFTWLALFSLDSASIQLSPGARAQLKSNVTWFIGGNVAAKRHLLTAIEGNMNRWKLNNKKQFLLDAEKTSSRDSFQLISPLMSARGASSWVIKLVPERRRRWYNGVQIWLTHRTILLTNEPVSLCDDTKPHSWQIVWQAWQIADGLLQLCAQLAECFLF